MPKLNPVDWRILVKRLRELGFEGPYSGGKHPFMVKGDLVLTIPNPHKGKIGVALLKKILKQAKISRNKWFETN